MTYCRHSGLIISSIVHLLVLIIPFSIVASRQFKEVEIFVLDNPARPHEYKGKITPPPKQTEIQPQALAVVSPLPEIIEPSVPTADNQKAQIVVPEPKPQIQTPKVDLNVSPAVVHAPTAASKPMLDVEFGSPNAPAFLHREMPMYPLIARRLGKEGRVLLRLTIDEKGRLLKVEVIEDAGYGFAEAAVEAVKKSTFKPAMQDGVPVMSKALLPIKFILRRD